MITCDLESGLVLFEPGAPFVVQTGTVKGISEICQPLDGFMALNPSLTFEAQQLVEAGVAAIYCAGWTLCGTESVRDLMQMSGRSSSILRRQINGAWLFLLDNP